MSIWKRYRWLLLAATCAVGVILICILQSRGLYLHIGQVDNLRAGGALAFLCILFLFVWVNSAIAKKTNGGGVGLFCLWVLEVVVLVFLTGILAFCDCESSYFTFQSPDGKHVVIAEEERSFHDFTVDFYELVRPGLMRPVKGGCVGDSWFISSGNYELIWENRSVVVRYYDYSYNDEGWRERRLPLLGS